MLSKIREHVDERASHFSGRRERTPVPARRPQRATPHEKLVHIARHANRHAAHPTRERAFVLRLHEKVQMVTLHGEVNDAEARRIAPRRATQGEPYGRKNMLTSQRSNPRAQRYENGLRSTLGRARAVGSERTRARRAAGPSSRATPRIREGKGELGRSPTRAGACRAAPVRFCRERALRLPRCGHLE